MQGMTVEELAHLRRARDLMDREYARPLDVPAMARAAHASPSHFARQFKEAYGETPYAYLMTRRIERAKALLRGSDLSVSEIALEVGCQSLGTFSTRFRELVGTTPRRYRARTPAVPAVPPCAAMMITRPSRNQEETAAAAD
jgi:AraC-like DNA-binding protein